MELLTVSQKFFILAVLLQLGFSCAQEAAETPQLKARRIFNEALNELTELTNRFQNASFAFGSRLSKPPPRPIQFLHKFINDNWQIKSLRESLDRWWPFWKISQRKDCDKLLDQKIAEYVRNFDEKVKNDFDWRMEVENRKISVTERGLRDLANILRSNEQKYLNNCEHNDNCRMKYGGWEDEVKNVGRIEDFLKTLDEEMKKTFETSIKKYIGHELVPSIQKCERE